MKCVLVQESIHKIKVSQASVSQIITLERVYQKDARFQLTMLSNKAKRNTENQQIRSYEELRKLSLLRRAKLRGGYIKEGFRAVRIRKHAVSLFNNHRSLVLLFLLKYKLKYKTLNRTDSSRNISFLRQSIVIRYCKSGEGQ